MDEGLSAIYSIVWNKIYKTLGHDDFKVALMMPPGWRGDEQTKDVKTLKIDLDSNKAILTLRDGHKVVFHYDPEGRIFEMLYGARLQGSPAFEAERNIWLKEYLKLHEDLKAGRISKREYNRRYADWRKRQPEEKDPDYVALFKAHVKGEISADDFHRAYDELGDRKWADMQLKSDSEDISELNSLSDADTIHLSERDAKTVFDLIENPPEPSPVLTKAMRLRNLTKKRRDPC